jgi:hypothetical protein
MALTWRSSAAYIPEAATDIWVRIYWWQGEPVTAQYNSSTKEVTVQANGLVIPFWAVSRWAYPENGEPTENEPEVDTYIDGLETALSTAQIGRLNVLVAGLKSDFEITLLNEKFYAWYVYRGETEESSLKNLVQDAFHCTKVNAPSWTEFLGFTGNGSNQVLRTYFNAYDYTAEGILNDMAIGAESNLDTAENGYVVRATDGTNQTLLAWERFDTCIGEINGDTSSPLEVAASEVIGKIWTSRTGASTQYLVRNGTTVASGESSNSVTNNELAFLGRVDGSFGSSGRIGFGIIGKGLTEAEVALCDARIQDYIDSLD